MKNADHFSLSADVNGLRDDPGVAQGFGNEVVAVVAVGLVPIWIRGGFEPLSLTP